MLKRNFVFLGCVAAAITGGCGNFEGARSVAAKAARDQAQQELEQIVASLVSDAVSEAVDLDALSLLTDEQ